MLVVFLRPKLSTVDARPIPVQASILFGGNIKFLTISTPGQDVNVTVRMLSVLMDCDDRTTFRKIALYPFEAQRAGVVAFDFTLEAGDGSIMSARLSPSLVGPVHLVLFLLPIVFDYAIS
jgi:hypothetical protein